MRKDVTACITAMHTHAFLDSGDAVFTLPTVPTVDGDAQILLLLVREMDLDVIGSVRVDNPFTPFPLISWLSVDEGFRRHGGGKALVQAVVDGLTHLDPVGLVCTVAKGNTSAFLFWGAMGFEPVWFDGEHTTLHFPIHTPILTPQEYLLRILPPTSTSE